MTSSSSSTRSPPPWLADPAALRREVDLVRCPRSLVGYIKAAWPVIEPGQPYLRYVATSHNERLGVRDNMKARRLVKSEWYQARWGDLVQLTKDQDAKTKFENTATGFREAMPFTSLTGTRGDRV